MNWEKCGDIVLSGASISCYTDLIASLFTSEEYGVRRLRRRRISNNWLSAFIHQGNAYRQYVHNSTARQATLGLNIPCVCASVARSVTNIPKNASCNIY